MNKRLYPRLAWQNLRRNGRFYLPYILTIAGASGAFYIMLALAGARDLPAMTRYVYLSVYVWIGAVITALFSIVFLFYTNSFLMKQRKRELGLYNVLGMGKNHIGRVLAFETLYTAMFGIGFGVVCGMLLQKLVTALMFKLAGAELPFGFYVSGSGIVITFILFAAILFVNLLYNLRRIRVLSAIELLHESAGGEREPKTRWLGTILGLAALGGGYAIALLVKSAVAAVAYYFVAVILVIIGTYLLFSSVSIAVLKLLRANKSFYYKTTNFIGVSGMLYRMKRNAVGLANICILSTMVLVMVSGTLSLYLGTEDALDTRYPADINAELRYDPTADDPFDGEAFAERLEQLAKEQGRAVEGRETVTYLSFAVGRDGTRFTVDKDESATGIPGEFVFITAEQYGEMTGAPAPELEADEILFYSDAASVGDSLDIDFANAENPNGETMSLRVAGTPDSFPPVGDFSVYMLETYYAVVADYAALTRIYEAQEGSYGDSASSVRLMVYLDIDGTAEEQMDCADVLSYVGAPGDDGTQELGDWEWYSVSSRAANSEDFYSTNGGFFFLGIFLGFLFIMATVLIIYYKQMTEGYEDKNRYRIMREVGLSGAEIRRSVSSQILVVFFAPLLTAAVHVAFDFRLVKMLLTLFGLTNAGLTLICTAGTLLTFILIYGVVFSLTARAYYRIVKA